MENNIKTENNIKKYKSDICILILSQYTNKIEILFPLKIRIL